MIKIVDRGSDLDYRDVVQRIDLRDLMAPGLRRQGDKPVKIPCVWHSESQASLTVYPDSAHCYGCGRHVTVLEWIALQEELDIETQFPDVIKVADEKYAGSIRVVPRPISEKELGAAWVPIPQDPALQYHARLGAKRAWYKARGLSDAMIDEFKLGHTGRAFSIPVWSANADLLTIRYRRDDALGDGGPKYWGTKGKNQVFLFNEKALTLASLKDRDFVAVVTEGELDAVRMWQEGFAAVSATNGARAFDQAFEPMFRLARLVVLCLDQDEAGRENAERIARIFKAKARDVTWDRDEGKDVTEYLQRHSADDLRALIEGARKKSVRYWDSRLRKGFWSGE